jgi:2-polyprenyl-3-methyl-5-hydroxy-6-metoxy-1,4-benzoquinol methylase
MTTAACHNPAASRQLSPVAAPPLAWVHVPCNLCGRDQTALLHRERLPWFNRPLDFTIVRCTHCHLVYTNPRLAQTNAVYLQTAPDPADLEAHAAAKAPVFARALDQLDALCPAIGTTAPSPRLLDLGAGSGHFVAAARRRGYDALALEPAPAWARYARQHLAIPVHQADFHDAHFAPDTFDIITAWDVLEHVEDPRALLARAALWLRPGGIFAARFPSASFQYLKATLLHRLLHSSRAAYAPTMHLTFFSPQTFAALAAQTGLTLLATRTTPFERNTGRAALDTVKTAAASALRLAELLARRPLGNLECFCRKDQT